MLYLPGGWRKVCFDNVISSRIQTLLSWSWLLLAFPPPGELSAHLSSLLLSSSTQACIHQRWQHPHLLDSLCFFFIRNKFLPWGRLGSGIVCNQSGSVNATHGNERKGFKTERPTCTEILHWPCPVEQVNLRVTARLKMSHHALALVFQFSITCQK